MWNSKRASIAAIPVAVAIAALFAVSQPVPAASGLRSGEDVSDVRVTKSDRGGRAVISITKGQSRVGSISVAPGEVADINICCFRGKDSTWTCTPMHNTSASAATSAACPILVYCTDQGICTPQ